MKKKLTKSAKKFIREEKARIRRETLGEKQKEKLIKNLYEKFLISPTNKKIEALKTVKKKKKKKEKEKKKIAKKKTVKKKETKKKKKK